VTKPRSQRARKLADGLVKAVAALSACAGLAALVWILYIVIHRGFQALNPAFFTRLPTPPGTAGGGLANAIVGTLLITVHATLFSVPVGIAAGIYLAEFGRGTWLARSIQFTTNILIGVPSIIIGVFVYLLLVVPLRTFSGIAGAAALGMIMLPVVVRTTEDMLALVPDQLRESALALGAARWQVTFRIVFRAARGGLLTGVLLAVARVSGETAPLLFTALNSPYWLHSLKEPVANLTVTIFNYAMSPYADWQQKAWGASLLIMFGVLLTTIAARLLLKRREGH